MADAKEEVFNPLYGIKVGSTVRSSTARFGLSALKLPVTIMHVDKHVSRFMTGSSAYVYSDRMNQGSFAVSGSYGVSGVSKVDVAVSGYIGNSAATSSKAVAVGFNVKMIAGIEHIDFDNLTAEQLVSALSKGPQDSLLDALTHFNELKTKVSSAETLYHALENPTREAELKALIDAWVGSVERFFQDYGDGLVVGVMWGGMGAVSLEMESKSGESSWKYGGRANFSYATATTAVSVAGTYDGGQARKESNVKVEVKSWASGGCVQAQVAEWSKTVEGKAFAEICDIKLLDRAPGLDKVPPAPAVPAFVTPKAPTPGIAAKFKELTNLDSLEAFATAAAYDKAKALPGNQDLSLRDFIEQSKKPVDVAPVEAVQAAVADNAVDVLAELLQAPGPRPAVPAPGLPEAPPPTALLRADLLQDEKKAGTDDYTPLGTWIANWADLFPWLATGYLNKISTNETAKETLRQQCMVQDLLTLSRMYYTFSTSDIDYKELGLEEPFTHVADSFGAALQCLRDGLNQPDIIKKTSDLLSPDAKAIYVLWNQNPFLRNAELGLGISYDGTHSVADEIVRVQRTTTSPTIFYKCDICRRGPKDSNTAFKSFLKVIPLLTPQGHIYAFGPSNMLLKSMSATDAEAGFTRRVATAMKLTPDKTLKVLKNDKTVLYPIHFTDAKGLTDWKGQILSTNLSANKPLADQLEKVKQELKQLNVYSFSSANWIANPDWRPNKPFRRSAIRTQYYGITAPIGTIFDA